MTDIPAYAGRTESDWIRAVANVTLIASEMKQLGISKIGSPDKMGDVETGRILIDFADRIFAGSSAPLPPAQPKTP